MGAPDTPAARRACTAAAVSFESGATPLSHPQPPDFACRERSVVMSALGTERPAWLRARIVQMTVFVWGGDNGSAPAGPPSPSAAHARATRARVAGGSGSDPRWRR